MKKKSTLILILIIAISAPVYSAGNFVEIFASSFLPQEGKNIYTPSCAWDGKNDTAWSEGVKGDGIGEWLAFTVNNDYSGRVNGIKIKNGYQKRNYVFRINNRVKKARIYFFKARPQGKDEIRNLLQKWKKENTFPADITYNDFDGKETEVYIKKVTLQDKFGWQYIKFDKKGKCEFILIEIKSVYPGTKYQDTCITEVDIYKSKESKSKKDDDDEVVG